MRSEVKNEGNILDDSVARILSSSFFDFSFFFFWPHLRFEIPFNLKPLSQTGKGHGGQTAFPVRSAGILINQ